MSVQYVSASNRVNTSSTSAVLNKPSGVQAGDLLLAMVYFGGGTGVAVTQATGWTQTTRADSTTVAGISVAWRVADGTEGSTFTWTLDSAQANGGIVVCLRGANQASPIDVSGSQSNASSTSVTAPSVTTTVDGDGLVFFGVVGAVVTFTAPSGMTEVSDGNSLTADVQGLTAAGATGTRVATASGAGVNIAANVAVKPALGTMLPMMGVG